VSIEGHLGPAEGLVERMARAGLAVTRSEARTGDGAIVLDAAELHLTDGRPATLRAAEQRRNLVVFDLVYDYATATRMAIAVADQAQPQARAAAAGFLQAL
jgi:3-hydroxybutyryl-CoA dehydrogenase